MKSIEEVYNSLRKMDLESKLTLYDESIELKVNEYDKVIAFADYVSIELNGEKITHWHPDGDYDEIYKYLLDIMEKREKLPTKKEIERQQRKDNITLIISTSFAIVFCATVGIENPLLRIIIIIIFIVMFYLLTGFIKNLKQNIKK